MVRLKSRPKVSIIIITKNQKKFLKGSIPAILGQTFKDFEIIVVDSGSIDGALEYLQGFLVKVIHYGLTKFNYARAFNLGARQAKGEILVRLSGDVIPVNSMWLVELIKPLSDSKIGATYSRQVALTISDWHHRLSLFIHMGKLRDLINWFALGALFIGASAAIKKSILAGSAF